jgi:O-antigen ligase
MALFALTRILDAHSNWRRKAPQAGILVAAVLAMLLSFSRACWINFGLALLLFLAGQVAFPGLRNQLSRRDLRRRIRIGVGVLVAGSISIMVLLSVPAVSEMLSARVSANGLQDYDRVRFATQSLALETAEKRPLGIGPGQVEDAFDYSTHSMYVRILTENGIVGLLALLAFIGATMARSVTVIERAEDPWFREINLVVLASIAGHLVNSFVIDTVHWRHIWFIYAIPWAPARLRGYAVRAVAWRPGVRSAGRTLFATPGFTGR